MTDPAAANLLVAFRADATGDIGGGHVMRCLTLADALHERGVRVSFATAPATGDVVPLLAERPYDVVDAKDGDAKTQAGEIGGLLGDPDLLVVDHYGLGAEFEKSCRNWAGHIVVLDDRPVRTHDCDLLIDQTYGRDAEAYRERVPDGARVLAGSEFALLRPEFARLRPGAVARRQAASSVERIYISCGASNPGGITRMAIAAITSLELDVEIDVAAGGATAEALGLKQRRGIHIHGFEAQTAELMANADLAIGAAGSTAWERCCLGLPSIIAVAADNQGDIARSLHKSEAVLSLGSARDLTVPALAEAISDLVRDAEQRRRMSTAAAAICDGLGVTRVLTHLTALCGQTSVTLRNARESDADLVFEWQCHPDTRRYANNPDVPEYSEHLDWFVKCLADQRRLLMIAESENRPVGFVRLDGVENGDLSGECVVSIVVSPQARGRGIGTQVLRQALFASPARLLRAEIHRENTASASAFRKAGFTQVDATWWHAQGRTT